jgi:hypothetical protein
MRLRTAFVAMLLAAVSGSAAPAPTNDRARLLKEFEDRAAIYSQLSRKAAATLPPLPDKATPEQIAAHQKALAKRSRRAAPGRSRARSCSTESFRCFLDLLRSDLPDRRDATRARRSRTATPARTRGPHTGRAEAEGSASSFPTLRIPGSGVVDGAARPAREAAEAAEAARVPLRRRPPDPPRLEASLVVDYLKEVVA